MARSGWRVGIVVVEARSLRMLRPGACKQNHWQVTVEESDGVVTLRQHAWNVGLRFQLGGEIWARLTGRLIERYAKMRGTPDLIHVQSAVWAGLAAHHTGQRLGVPYVVTEHSSLLLDRAGAAQHGAVLREIYGGASALAAVSETLVRAMQPFVGERSVAVTPNLVSDEFVTNSRLPAARTGTTYICVCNLIRKKGIAVLLRAFAKLASIDPAVRLRVVGDGPERNALQRLRDELGLASHVEFLGAQPRSAIPRLLAAADFFVHPSFVETFSIVLIEALAAGLPVVATRCGGPVEIVNRIGGVLVDVDDVGALARGLAEIRGVPETERQAMRARTIEYFGSAAFSRRQESFYCEGITRPTS